MTIYVYIQHTKKNLPHFAAKKYNCGQNNSTVLLYITQCNNTIIIIISVILIAEQLIRYYMQTSQQVVKWAAVPTAR